MHSPIPRILRGLRTRLHRGTDAPRRRRARSRRLRTLTALAACAALAATGLSACSTAGSSGGDHTIRIGIKFDQPGLGLKDGSRYTGFDVDMGRAIAAELGYTEDEITWVQAVSAQRETMLENGQVDLVIGTYSITDARRQRIDFAGPYFVAGQDLLIRDDSTITGPDDLDGRILCSVEGSTSAQKIRKDYPGSVQLFPVRTYAQCTEFLAAGTVDAVTTDNIILAGFASQDLYSGSLRVVGNTFSTEKYGVGVPKGQTDRCLAVNRAITDLVEDGTWQRLLDNNVGGVFTPDASLNPPVVDDSLCG